MGKIPTRGHHDLGAAHHAGAKSTSTVGSEVLDQVLGPLDPGLLGVHVHMDRVHLNVTAVPRAGN
ncbi:MAG TPA: hypothetical protein VIL68_10920 [Propionibacteriaceae bacterium]